MPTASPVGEIHPELRAQMRRNHNEVRQLLKEMAEILQLPSVQYELFPRLKITLELLLARNRDHLYPFLRSRGIGRALCARFSDGSDRIEELLQRLDQKPWKKEQTNDPEWERLFGALKEECEQHLRAEEEELFPVVRKALSPVELRQLATTFAEWPKVPEEKRAARG